MTGIKKITKQPKHCLLQKALTNALAVLTLILSCFPASSQQPKTSPTTSLYKINFSAGKASNQPTGLFGTEGCFIENIGQYGETLKDHPEMGKILYAYEGMGMPVLFTEKGIVHLLRKLEGPNEEEREREEREREREKEREREREREGKREREKETKKQERAEEEFEEQTAIDKAITVIWLNANTSPLITAEEVTEGLHTYASVKGKAKAYRRLVYHDIYTGVDLVYSFFEGKKFGFEYSLIIKPGADISIIKKQFGGDIKNIRQLTDGSLQIQTEAGGIKETVPVSFYGSDITAKNSGEKISSAFLLSKKELSFSFPKGYDKTKALVIDPFVVSTGNLTGLNAGKAKDVDFDYAGNVYVTGGGSGLVSHQLAKFNASGALQWTFNGTLTIPSWTFGSYWGGWMVEKPTGNIYLGQGFNPTTGFQVIRVNTNGLYDNFITTANPNFREAWKMLWSCNNGSPQILVAGGGTNSNINFGVFVPPSASVSALNVTNIPYTVSAGWAQDIVDFIIDPSNNDMYTIYGSLFGNPSLTNKIYKNTFPYSGASVAWNVPSGFTAVQEIANRPYLAGGNIDNSANIFALNAFYLFYWDGKNLKAFDKASGAGVGAPLITSNTLLMQGGIIADACNNIFIGDANGVIKVYSFNGTTFSDAPADINIPGFSGKAIYDLAYDESKKLLYASGDGFVASFDVSAYCPTTQYTLNVVPNCLTSSATVTVTPAPLPGSTITYTLFIGSTQIATNTTGVFTGLTPNTTYTVVATINQLCSGTQATTTFVLPGPTITVSSTNTTCGNNTGSITASGSGTTGPYTYSIDGTNFQSSGTFTGLAAGVYTVTVKDVNGCKNTATVTVVNTNGPTFTFTTTNAECGSNNGSVTITASGGTAPYQYSINGGTTYQASNFFTGLVGGTYTAVVKDANNCTNAAVVTITSSPAPQITATPATATCGSNNGTITAFGSAGTPPLQYSINGNTYQSSNVFSGVTPGTYTVYVKDANNCIATTTVTVANSPAPTITAVATSATCNNANGIITATASGGIAPLQYSINGITFQASNIFTGLAPGGYTITVKDATGCTNIATVTVGTSNSPTATAASAPSACNVSNGSITITGSGGTPPYTYSINGTTFQASNIFTGLAPANYVAYVKDAGGCIGTTLVTVSPTAGPTVSVTSTPTACGANTGTITITGSGGTPPLQYSLDGITYQAGNVFNGLATGIYTVYVKDANGCFRTAAVAVSNTSNLTLSVGSISSSCTGSSGTVTATATGGIGALQYSIDGVTYQSSNIFTGVAPGVYTVYVKDANNCIVTKQVTVTSVPGPSLTVAIQFQATCGTASGVIVATATGGVPPITYNIDGGAFQTNRIFINVAPGTHTILAKDANGCLSSPQTATITNSGAGAAPTDVTFVVRDLLACTGEGRIKNIKGVPSGGGNNYTFSLDGGAFTTANQFRPVAPGVHTVTAKNQNGCTVTRLATIGVGTAATATGTSTPSVCGGSTGTITIVGVGAQTPYHASIDNGATWITFFPPGANSLTFSGLAPGTYPIIIADDADFIAGPPDIPGVCLTTIYVTVPSTGGPSISTTQTNPSCSSSTGSITATGSGGVAPYTYNINGGAYQSSGTFNNLAPGTYAVNVLDATGCSTGVNIILPAGAAPTATASALSTSCNINNGVITVTASGGTAPLDYSINGTTFQSSNIFSNLAPGNYTVYVKDANACYTTVTATITATQTPRVTAFAIPASCNVNDGSIVATGTLGTTPYLFSIDGVVYQSSGTFTNLAAGFYTIYIKDARDCISTTGISVPNISGLSITNTTTTSATCGNANGSITVTASGGTAPLQYSIDGTTFQTSNIFTNLLPGTYVVTVKDAAGCIYTKAVVVANINGPQTLTAVIVHAACGQNNGTITATATGGTPLLQYSINGTTYQASNVFTGVAPGTYTLYVKDANNCIKTLANVVVLDLPAPSLTLSASPATCGQNDGSIVATATGGTGALTYSKDGITYQNSNVFLNLAAGTYTIRVKDARGCITPQTITVPTAGSAIVPVFTQVPPICAGAPLAALPTTSNNGITGTWTPAINNTVTTTYTFTPTVGQCATTATMTITVNPKPGPIIIYHN